MRQFKFVKIKCETALLKENTIFSFFLEPFTRAGVMRVVNSRHGDCTISNGCLFDHQGSRSKNEHDNA